MQTFLSIVLRLLLAAAGLVFAASVAVVAALLGVVWLARAGWARLTGRRVQPFVVRFRTRTAARSRSSAAPRRPEAPRHIRGAADIVDVEAK